MQYKIEVVLKPTVDQIVAGYIADKIIGSWSEVTYAKVCASENKEENCHITQQTNGAEPSEITPCPCEKGVACMNGHVGMEDCPKYIKTA